MHKDTEKVLERIMEQSRSSSGVIKRLQGGNNVNHIDWLFKEEYLQSTYNPVRASDGTMYMYTMPTEKAYEWERERQETASGRAYVIRARLENELVATESMRETVRRLGDEAQRVGKAWCGSSLGNHAKVYYQGLEPVPADAHWDAEWGMIDRALSLSKTRGDWQTYTIDKVEDEIFSRCGTTQAEMSDYSDHLLRIFGEAEVELMGILEQSEGETTEETRQRLLKDIKAQRRNLTTAADEVRQIVLAHMPSMSRDMENVALGAVTAAHHHVLAGVKATRNLEWGVEQLRKIASQIPQAARRKKTRQKRKNMRSSKVFIGHDGQSHAWRAVKDHLEMKRFEVEEFERTPVAGKQIKDRLEEMMEDADSAVMIVTARDMEPSSTNVIHEIGFAQGRLGWEKVIILLQEGCTLPSNLNGTVQLRFKDENIKSVFSDLEKNLRVEEHH